MKNIPYGKQSISQEDIDAVISTLKSDFLTQGPKIEEFENRFASYVNSKYAVAVSNGTTALHLCALVLMREKSKKILVPAITFAASSNCILYVGGSVEFVDIDPKTYLIDLNQVESLIKKNPENYQGVIPVDLAGYPVATHELKTICDKYGLWSIEDACHAPGARVNADKKSYSAGSGEFCDLGIFSFHPVKHIACGEGGMITTNDSKLYDQLKILRTHGITKNANEFKEASHGDWYHEMQVLGHNYRLPDLNAALGLSQLTRAAAGLERRREIASRYDSALSKLPIQLPYRADNIEHAFHLYVIQTEQRKELHQYLKSKNIFSQVHYIPVYWHPYYKELGFKKGQCIEAEKYYSKCLSLPMYPSLTNEEQDYVVSCIGDFFNAR